MAKVAFDCAITTAKALLEASDFEAMGKIVGWLRVPTLVVQEGGYDTRILGANALNFMTGQWSGTCSN